MVINVYINIQISLKTHDLVSQRKVPSQVRICKMFLSSFTYLSLVHMFHEYFSIISESKNIHIFIFKNTSKCTLNGMYIIYLLFNILHTPRHHLCQMRGIMREGWNCSSLVTTGFTLITSTMLSIYLSIYLSM